MKKEKIAAAREKLRRLLKGILLCFFAAAVCLGLFYLVDVVWNGAFVDWFEKYYMYTHSDFHEGQETLVITKELHWYRVKRLLLSFFCISMSFWLFLIWAVSRFYARREVKRTVSEVGCLLRSYMAQEKVAADIFPKEYGEIAVQAAEIRATMQRREQELKDEVSRKNDMVTYLAHDLKTPLTSVVGYLSLLLEAPSMPCGQRVKYTGIALEKAQRLEKLINEFFEITRYNLSHIELEKESIDLSYMLFQMSDEFYPLLQAHGNTIELRTGEELMIYGDPARLARVFNNILKNAIAYSYPDTVIRIWTDRTAADIQIFFQNIGKTIPPRKLQTVFDKFFRLDEARTSDTGGAGLGLAIAKEIVALHGGRILAESENELTTFRVILPGKKRTEREVNKISSFS